MIKGIIFDWETGLRRHYETNQGKVEDTLMALKMKGCRLGLIAEEVDIAKTSEMFRNNRLRDYFDVLAMATSSGDENYHSCRGSMKTTPQSTLFIGGVEQCARAKHLGMQIFVANEKVITPDLENLTSILVEETMVIS